MVDNFEIKLTEALKKAEKIKLEQLPSDEDLKDYHKFSDDFNLKMLKIIKKEKFRRGIRKFSSRRNKIAAIIVCIALIGAGTFGVKAWRMKFFDFVLNTQEEYTEIRFSKTDEYVEKKDSKLIIYKLKYIPKGYELNYEEALFSMYLAEYKNNEEKYLVYHQYTVENSTMQIDTEGTTLEDITINGLEGYFYSNKGYNNILWNDGHYGFWISGEISKDEIIKIAENIRKID